MIRSGDTIVAYFEELVRLSPREIDVIQKNINMYIRIAVSVKKFRITCLASNVFLFRGSQTEGI